MPTRRDCLRGGGLAAAALATSGCAGLTHGLSQPEVPVGRLGEATSEPADWRAELALQRTVRRTSYGARVGELGRIRQIGLDAYLEEQLHPEHLDETPAVGWRLWRLDTLQ